MKTLFKQLALTVIAISGFSAAHADPISGTVGFNAVGEILVDGTGAAAGYNSFENGGCPTLPSPLDPTPCASTWTAADTTGTILDMLIAGFIGGPVTIEMSDDFSLVSPSSLTTTATTSALDLAAFKHVGVDSPVIEWILGPVADPFGVRGTLVFDILSGSDTDGAGPHLDLAGTGLFRFVRDCDPLNGGSGCTAADATSVYEDTIGGWSLSDAGGLSISGRNVPAPAVLGLFGLGLLGLGLIRRKRTSV